MHISIKLLNQKDQIQSQAIYQVFQESYKVEAELLGVTDFPPLSRTIENFMASETQFYAALTGDKVVGVVEIDLKNSVLDICSLVVSPDYFRQGIGKNLMSFILEKIQWEEAVVETGSENVPAIKLYQGFGFQIIHHWMTEHGIEKVKMTTTRIHPK